jgi:hypothetical protein
MSEARRFSEKSVRPPSCVSPLKFRAPNCLPIDNLDTNWISSRRRDRKTLVHSHWSYLTVASSSFIYSKKPRFYIFFFDKKLKYNIVGTMNQFFFRLQ